MAIESRTTTILLGALGSLVATGILAAAPFFTGDWDALRTVLLSRQMAAVIIGLGLAGVGMALWRTAHRRVTVSRRAGRHHYDREIFWFQAVGLVLVVAGVIQLLYIFQSNPPPGWHRLFS